MHPTHPLARRTRRRGGLRATALVASLALGLTGCTGGASAPVERAGTGAVEAAPPPPPPPSPAPELNEAVVALPASADLEYKAPLAITTSVGEVVGVSLQRLGGVDALNAPAAAPAAAGNAAGEVAGAEAGTSAGAVAGAPAGSDVLTTDVPPPAASSPVVVSASQRVAALSTPVALSSGPQGWAGPKHLVPASAYLATVSIAAERYAPASAQRQVELRFTTREADQILKATLSPGDGLVAGIGQALVVNLSKSVPKEKREEIENRLTVYSDKPLSGAWSWASNRELRFHGEKYWPANTRLALEADLTGVQVGPDFWGRAQKTRVEFKIGKDKRSVADLKTKRMKVYENGKLVREMRISGGKPGFLTMGGTHVLMTREKSRRLRSITTGIPAGSAESYDVTVKDAVRFSDSGGFVHGAPWSVGSQGRRNVSHGCINASPKDARWYREFSQIGDILDITGTARGPVMWDHGVIDWSQSWESWLKSSATGVQEVLPIDGEFPAPPAPKPAPPAPVASPAAPTPSASPAA